MKKRLLSLLLILGLLLCTLPGAFARKEEVPRDWYEIFVRSFCDSDGDGLGDLNGVTQKLDYVRDLGFTGIWLMPIMPSPSYHKYDVTDYYGVDPEYGTLDDLRGLISQAHARGISVILDLPVNHCSSEHPWFLSACEDPDSEYRDWFVWSESAQSGYHEAGGAWYEGRFTYGMPDLNLDEPAVRNEIASILAFWLNEVGVDGFRLDAVTSFYTGDLRRNVEFLDWLSDEAHRLRPDCFLVAEAWEGLSEIAAYAESRVDSFFTFPVSQAEGYIAKTLARANKHSGRSWGEYTALLEETLPAATIPAPFTENHDTGRTVGFTGRSDPDKTKMAFGLLATMRGGIFVYYGQEIGMAGSGEDPNKRVGMLWTDASEVTLPPPGATNLEYSCASVRDQEDDPASLLSYYRQAMTLRHSFPVISSGESRVLSCADERVCLILRSCEDEEVLLIINPSASPVRLVPADSGERFTTLAAFLCTDPDASVFYRQGTLRMPPRSIAVLTR